MRNNPLIFIIVITAVILILDIYTYRGIKKLVNQKSIIFKRFVFTVFWSIPLTVISGLIILILFRNDLPQASSLKYFHPLSGTFILFYLPKLVFIIFNLLDDLIILVRKILPLKSKSIKPSVNVISRRRFITQTGIIAAGLPFLSIAYGIKWGRFNYTIRNHKLSFSNLPKSFDGFRILQISDFHLGSFIGNEDRIEDAVKLINNQNADLILFTGDLINNVSNEIDPFVNSLKKLKAKFGIYSVLGNHDYGEYVHWNSNSEKIENLQRTIKMQQEIGFKLLINESSKISINNESIELLGVENWGLKPFPQYGDLNKAMQNTPKDSFKILMSHDPTHWDEQVLGKTNIDLTLSGHTHGAQFGIEIPGWRWSPVNLRYKRWGGLYKESSQYLYVNTGIGFIGFPGRVGMPPEITILELKNNAIS